MAISLENHPYLSHSTEVNPLNTAFGFEKLPVDLEKASERLIGIQNKFIEEGRYDILSSPEYRDGLDVATKKYGRAAQRKLKGDLVYSWLVDQENFIENRSDESRKDTLTSMPRWKFGKYQMPEYATAQMNLVFSNVAAFQKSGDTQYLHEIETSRLVQGAEGLLKLQAPKDLKEDAVKNSPIQHSRMFLLGIAGLSASSAESVVEYVKQPPNTSRSIVGKLPAGIIHMGARLGLDWSDKANYGWPTPAEGGSAPLPPKTDRLVYERARDVRLDYVKSCLENGWDLPALGSYLPREVTSNRKIMRELVVLRKENRKVGGWNSPHIRGEDGVVYSRAGAVVKTVERPTVVIPPAVREQRRSGVVRSRLGRSLIVALLGFFN
jgi:hypothetical protein